jgi:hypothetical protein
MGHRRNAGHGADRRLGARAHRLPLLHRIGIDRNRKEHLAVGRDYLREFPRCRQRRAVGTGNLGERNENIVFHGRHERPPGAW